MGSPPPSSCHLHLSRQSPPCGPREEPACFCCCSAATAKSLKSPDASASAQSESPSSDTKADPKCPLPPANSSALRHAGPVPPPGSFPPPGMPPPFMPPPPHMMPGGPMFPPDRFGMPMPPFPPRGPPFPDPAWTWDPSDRDSDRRLSDRGGRTCYLFFLNPSLPKGHLLLERLL
ncbi:hypothetical protein WMY93_028361 [Mugilogobius chulae]|uniref:Uncharacterized protein n=1 Tax=Mugilogobius chulae TaxID=88201 RepID=A0AAW0MN29_9GOBI